VCGGFVGSVPQLCDVQVIPPQVPLFGEFQIEYCRADLEGNVNQLCYAFAGRNPPTNPPLNCHVIPTEGGPINGCTTSEYIPSTEPVGDYFAVVRVEDRSGFVSNTVRAPFAIVP
jgi:hypothetical protein